MMKAFIVEDEPLARDELKYLLKRSRQVEVVGEAEGIEDAMRDISRLKPELVFLDIELADGNGLHLAKQLAELDPAPSLIFATAYDEFALQAFELYAFDYLLKPFNEKRIRQTLDKLMKQRQIGKEESGTTAPASRMAVEQTGKLAVVIDDRIVLIDRDHILFIGLVEGKTVIKTGENEYKIGDPLIVLEKKLDKRSFLRVHRSFIVNVIHISEIQPWFNSTYNLIMSDGSNIPVSRTYVKELKQLIGF
ncbi:MULTISPECIES: LytTR family DNA-binding domain-containing protein [unclassified Bacillus (in: firmicutes)]|uniref:LytR/AlgR family response regulator transcription factor n=1 Tax=unclassified Bacillus (in: firmicutes) TaxID=185979 RepID=UPI001BEC50BB|nr:MULTISPECIES: LytTR family transcriptional regulator DNA-binding domain-containing protein [unclassified Bacillus (in: firmicutes)]MBT2616527.1 LytTR family transcriptional regulator DNA-binding domain-containing protein [Bacillus sp. ISL-78]MBT2629945.1 LytTR family transcriptional regulator DNA-binding domain-containing protein [Bacillus sp. ISL-101]